MPAKRRLPKGRNFIVTPAIVEAWKARDELALHRACGLRPWEPSPLNCHLGVRIKPTGTAWEASTPRVVEMRAEILKALGTRHRERS